MGRVRWFLEGSAHYITMWIGARYGESFPMHFVCGYPRSGTTWFSELLADYLNLPRPRHYIFPIGFAAVIHTHADSTHRLNDCFYVLRDGRDSIVSAYFKLIKTMREDEQFVYRDHYLKLFGPHFDPKATEANLPLYMRYVFERKKNHWGEHVMGWLRKARNHPERIVVLKYEDLLDNTYETLALILEQKYGFVDQESARDAVMRQDFSRQKKRPQWQQRTYMRKGVSGDWRNWFTAECANIFNAYGGEALIETGYEEDSSWMSSLVSS